MTSIAASATGIAGDVILGEFVVTIEARAWRLLLVKRAIFCPFGKIGVGGNAAADV